MLCRAGESVANGIEFAVQLNSDCVVIIQLGINTFQTSCLIYRQVQAAILEFIIVIAFREFSFCYDDPWSGF